MCAGVYASTCERVCESAREGGCVRMAVSAARMKANHKYDEKTYDKLTIRVKKTDMARVRECMGDMSINSFINQAILEKVDRELKGK